MPGCQETSSYFQIAPPTDAASTRRRGRIAAAHGDPHSRERGWAEGCAPMRRPAKVRNCPALRQRKPTPRAESHRARGHARLAGPTHARRARTRLTQLPIMVCGMRRCLCISARGSLSATPIARTKNVACRQPRESRAECPGRAVVPAPAVCPVVRRGATGSTLGP